VILSGNIPLILPNCWLPTKWDSYWKNYQKIRLYFPGHPAVNLVSDAVILSKWLTGILFVVRAGMSERASVLNAVNNLKFVGGNILGFVLNGVKTSRMSGNYFKYSQARGN
jgi:hypothetical protein